MYPNIQQVTPKILILQPQISDTPPLVSNYWIISEAISMKEAHSFVVSITQQHIILSNQYIVLYVL